MAHKDVPLRELLDLDLDVVTVEPERRYDIAGVYGFGRGVFGRSPITGSETSYRQLNRLHTEQLVMSRLKAFEGAISLVPDRFDGWYVSPEFPTFSCRQDVLDPAYLAYLCRWPHFWTRLAASSTGIGARRERVHPEALLAIRVPLPPIKEQRQIAARLKALTDSTAELGVRMKRADSLTGALAVAACARFDLSDDEKARSGWRRVRLAELMDVMPPDVVVEPSVSYSIAGLFSFGRGLINRGRIVGADTSYRTLRSLAQGDVVMSKLNGWEGAVAVVPKPFAGYCVSSEYPVFRPNPDLLVPGFFSGIARSPWFWESLNRSARGSMVRRRRITGIDLLDTEIWVPPIASQIEIANQLVTIDRLADLRNQARTRLDALGPAALNAEFGNLN
jgi:type I restriction enzyme S subunit